MLNRIFIAILVLSNLTYAQTDLSTWHLPQTINTKNSTLNFELDTTWHLLEGQVLDFLGEAKLVDPKDPSSVSVNLVIPVKAMDTDNSMRDEKMRKVMDAVAFAEIIFTGQGLSNKCTPALVIKDGKCNDLMKGKIKIKDIEKDIEIPISIVNRDKNFDINGKYIIKWAEFGVEDPSILIAKVQPEVTVKFAVKLEQK